MLCSPAGTLLTYAFLLVLSFPLSISAGVPTPHHLPPTSLFLVTSLTWDQHFLAGCRRILLSWAFIFSLFCTGFSRFYQSCVSSYPELFSFFPEFVLDLQEEKEVSARFCTAWHGQGQTSLLSSLASWLLSSSGPWDMLCHPTNTCVPLVLLKGEQDSAWWTLPAQERLRLAASQLVPSATSPHSRNREVTPPHWVWSALPRTVVHSSDVLSTFQHILICTKFWPAVLIWQSGMGFWHVVKYDLWVSTTCR